ncbi:sigma-70 family RNA polymerase sigma factor [bacterium]|nr:sigma-70 family RNA polymerase sigma factor [bacterium]
MVEKDSSARHYDGVLRQPEGEEDFFASFCTEALPTLWPYACGLVRRLNLPPDLANDIVQEVAVRLLARAANKDTLNVAAPLAYARTAIKHVAYDYLKKSVRDQENVEGYAETTASVGGSVACFRDLEIDVADLLRDFGALNRSVVLRLLRDGKSVEEVASELKLAPDAVRQRYHRTLRKLRTRLKSVGY